MKKKKKNAAETVTRAMVDAAAVAFRVASDGVDAASATFARALASFFPSKGKGKVRVPKEEAEAIGEAAGVGASRIRGLLSFGDAILAGFVGTERDFRSRNSGKGKGGRPKKSPAERIAAILSRLSPDEIDATLDEARDIACALSVADDDSAD